MSGRPFFVDAARVLADRQRGRGALAGRADELFRGCSPKNFLARLQSWHQFVPYILMVVGSVIGVGRDFRAYLNAAHAVVSDIPGGPRGYQVLVAAVQH